MYTVSKGPSKLVAKSRRGLNQNYEKIDTLREISKKTSEIDYSDFACVPKPVFQTSKKSSHYTKPHIEEILSPQHEEIIKYIHESWNMVVAQNPYDSSSPSSPDCSKPSSPASNTSTSSVYYADPPSPVLSNFTPFDLESWWGRRLFNNITKSEI